MLSSKCAVNKYRRKYDYVASKDTLLTARLEKIVLFGLHRELSYLTLLPQRLSWYLA